MPRYIDADKLSENIIERVNNPAIKSWLLSLINEAPIADVSEVKRGEWILEREPDNKPYCYHCSVCDSDFHYIGIKACYNYCPHCGAKMGGKDD